jgi:uncharacterized protein YecE (DUF72 family)
MPKLITHSRKLGDCSDLVDEFLAQSNLLDTKLAVLLVQLPPKLSLDEVVATNFFALLRSRTGAQIACEPRHISWFTSEADTLLERLAIARVGADPAICEAAAQPGNWTSLRYWRLHGSPVIYRSSYHDRISDYARQVENEVSAARQVWCIFDNTASGAGTGDALELARATSREAV